MKRFILLIVSFFVLVSSLCAQNVGVADFYLDEHDLTAMQQGTMVLDSNGEKCALIKITLPATHQTGFNYDAGSGGIIKAEKRSGETWLYVPYGVKHLTITNAKMGVCRTYLFPKTIQRGNTYRMKIALDNSNSFIEDNATSSYVVFQVKPSNAIIELNGQRLETYNGTAQKYMKFGTYEYKVHAPNHYSATGTVTVNNPYNKEFINVELKSNMAHLAVSVGGNAEIWVNGEKKGYGNWQDSVTVGTYRLEAKLTYHRTTAQTITVGESDNRHIELQVPEPIFSKINVVSWPAMADIILDGKPTGTTPIMLSKVLIGRHNIVIRKAGYGDYYGTVNLTEGKTSDVNVHLSTATDVILHFTPSNAKIMIDSTEYDSSQKNCSLSYGNHVITMRAEGYKDLKKVINVTSNTKSFALTMESLTGKKTFTIKGVSFVMLPVEGGAFDMGTPSVAEPVHSVILNHYHIGETEVTQALWEAVMGKNPSNYKNSSHPVEQVSWDDCQKFITKLNAATGQQFSLPTEAEWEYAARGGKKSRGYQYSGSNVIDDVAWYDKNSKSSTYPVKAKQPNELGLYDMNGNVWEWCSDWYGNYSSIAQTNPTGPANGTIRVYRGGSWYDIAKFCGVASRTGSTPDSCYSNLGFRLVLR